MNSPKISLFRAIKDGRIPLEAAGQHWLCSENDEIVLEVLSRKPASIHMAGQELPIQRISTAEDQYRTTFTIFIDSWAGRTTLIVQADEKRKQVVLEVSPSDRKFGRNEFDQMLAELTERSESLVWGLTPGKTGGALASKSPAAVHPAVIESQLPILERLLTHISENPPTTTLRTREMRPLDLSKRMDQRTLRWLSTHPQTYAAVLGMADAGATPNHRRPVDQPLQKISIDHPITRYFVYLLRKIVRRLQETAGTLRKRFGKFPDEGTEAHAQDLANRVDHAITRIEQVLKRHPFRLVQPSALTETALQALPDHPLYSAIHRIGRRLLAPGLGYVPGGDIYSSLKRTYNLFELLVLYRLIDATRAALGQGWALKEDNGLSSSTKEEHHEDGACWRIDGPGGLTVELIYQRTFNRLADSLERPGFSSLSGMNLPDYILVMKRGTELLSWLIVDAKYRSGRQSIDEGLGDIHRYRDALRLEGTCAAGAFIVVPCMQRDDIYGRPDYHDRYCFGVLQMNREDWSQPIENWLHTARQLSRNTAPRSKPGSCPQG